MLSLLSPRARRAPALAVVCLVACLTILGMGCEAGSATAPEPGAAPPPPRVAAEAAAAALVYEPPAGFCADTDADGLPYSPARPLWSDLDGPHYDGLVHTDGSQSVRYPDYRNVSHNLAVLQTLQFLLSTVSNLTNRIEGAQQFLEEAEYVDALYGAIPQVEGHCLCVNKAHAGGPCDPQTILGDVEAAVTELLDVHGVTELLRDFLEEKIEATVADLQDLADWFLGRIQPSGALATALEQALYDVIDQELADAAAQMLAGPAAACDPAQIADYATALTDAVQTAVTDLRAELLADFQAVQDAIDLAIALPTSVLNQLRSDVETLLGWFDGVESFADLVHVDWAGFVATVQGMVPYYQGVVSDVQAAIQDVSGVWEDLVNFDARVQQLADDVYQAVRDQLAAANADFADCVAALEDALSYATTYDPQDFVDDLTAALRQVVEDEWDAARARVQQTLDALQERLTGVGLEDALSGFETRLDAVRAVVTDAIAECYLRGTRPECFDFCEADAATAQDDFFWLPVDFLQDPQATAAGVLSGALFALEQTAWLDQVVEWVDTQMEGQLGTAFSTVLAVLSDFSSSIQSVIDWLTAFFGYVDRFTEGYHLGAYSELRPDLHLCVGYAGHGVYAQMGSLGADTFSIGARYSAHNLSQRQRVQFRSGGFAISAFGHDLSLAPTLELNVQLDGWKLWDQTRPFGIPLGATIDPDTVARLDVFNVVPMDDYPFGYGTSVPIGATIVRDLFPSRPTAAAAAEWPRPGVAEPWEDRSVAVMSLGLNLHFEHGPIVKELPAIQIIPAILVAVPYFGISFGADWIHQTDLLRDRVQEMINTNLPTADQLTADDFLRDMHALQAPDLTADDGTAVFVEPELGVEAFLGFRIWKVKIGAGAKLGLAVNIRPGGYGGVVDLNAALADALLHSNPPADAPCEPVWDVTSSTQCTNETFPESTGDYACEPADAEGSCCVTVVIEGGPAIRRFAACLDAWTGVDAGRCRLFDVSGTADEVRAKLDSLPAALDPIANAIEAVLGQAQAVTLRSDWRASASCAEQPCGGDGFQTLFTTAGLAVSALSECQQYGFCTYADGTVVHDTTLARCEEARGGFGQVDAGRDLGCALSGQGVNTCWPDSAAPTGPFAEVTAAADWACGRSTAGAVTCWGANNASGQQDVPAGTFRDVDAGDEAACGVLDTQELVCWGRLATTPLPAGPFAAVSVGDRHACGLRPTGAIACWGGFGAPAPFGTTAGWTQVLALAGSTCALDGDGEATCVPPAAIAPACDLEALLSEPARPFAALTAFGPCAVCGLGRDASVTCWGDLPGAVPPSFDRFLDFDGHVDGPYLCGVTPDHGIDCWNGPEGPAAPPTGTFIGYTCRTETDATVAGWTGDGCHPLQQGFASACGCAEDDDCAAGETCDAEAGRCVDSAGAPLSCVCDSASACPAGRSCRDGACVNPCATDADCPPGRVCDGGSCVPPHGVPYAEEITWGMSNVTAPMHVINSYAMADILATLLLKIDLYVEASFKLFKKERTWTLFDWHKALDLGSTWKGWYQPGLEAFYQHECDNPALDEPVTNRYPRSLTSNPFDAIFEAAGISDPARHCADGGVCRYRDPLPASQTDPADYATGNVGTVAELLTWCKADLPQYVENPTPSTNDRLVDGNVDTAQWGEDVTIELWERNQLCIDGVVWDEWLASLEPTVAEDGTVLDPGAFASQTCRYDDPRTGLSHTFPCTDVNAEMLRLWGCLRTDLNLFATLLAGEVPGYLTTDPDTGAPIFDVAAIFPGVAASDPVYGAGIDYSYTVDAMDPVVRFAYGPSPFTIPRLGEFWLETVDACFGARFESLDETACECATDADCATDEGERCESGACQGQQTYDDAGLCLAADCAPVWTWSECPIVYLFVAAGPCCGDGVVQATDAYSEECDDGPEGSAACSATCELLDGEPTGACCVPGGCIDAAPLGHCARREGVWHVGRTCAELNSCQPPEPTGACCLPTGCLDATTAPVCRERGGAWHEGGACSAAGLCPEPTGACCVPEGCLEAASAQDCKGRNGVWHVGLTCDVPGVCPLPDPTGACCLADDSCVDATTAKECIDRKGLWHEARTCAEQPCGAPTGACCRGLTCVDDIPEAKCGGAWHERRTCEEIPCGPVKLPLGACCVAGACREALPAVVCARAGGTWSRGLTCAEVDTCHPPAGGACCLGRSCHAEFTLPECVERGGGWRVGGTCSADPDPCAPAIIKPPPGRDCVPGRLGCPIGGKG